MSSILLVVFATVLLLAAASDFLRFRIPNALVAVLLILYPAWVLSHPQAVPWLASLGIFVGSLMIALAAFRFGLLGAGDGKLLATVLLWAGPQHSGEALLVMGLAGGVVALLYGTAARFTLARAFERLGSADLRNNLLADRLPYGIAIAAGGIHFAVDLIAHAHGL